MTKQLRIGRWILRVDAEATRAAMASPLQPDGAEGCGCAYCRNYVSQRHHLYPPAMVRLFDELGVDLRRDAEVVEYARSADGLHEYGIWYHLVGQIEAGAEAWVPTGAHSSHLETEDVGGGFSIGFSHRSDMMPPSFAGLPVVQLDISFRIPWVLEEPDPGS